MPMYMQFGILCLYLSFYKINLTSLSIPWFPSKKTTTAKLINEIVAGEETDEDQNGESSISF